MKKSIAIIAILLLIAGAAYARMTVVGIAGMVAAPAGYSEHLLFLWNSPSGTTVDYSAGDNTGTAVGTVEITGGAVVTTDTGSNGDDYYSFTATNCANGGCDEIDVITGSVFIRFEVTTYANYGYLWQIFEDTSDYFGVRIVSNKLQFVYRGSTASIATATVSTNTVYWARATWQYNADGGEPGFTIEFYNDNSGSMGSSIETVENTTNNPGNNWGSAGIENRVGNAAAVNAVHKIYRVAVYSDVRSTEP